MDFMGRKALVELGYTDSLDELDELTAEAFGLIAGAIFDAQQRSWKKANGGR